MTSVAYSPVTSEHYAQRFCHEATPFILLDHRSVPIELGFPDVRWKPDSRTAFVTRSRPATRAGPLMGLAEGPRHAIASWLCGETAGDGSSKLGRDHRALFFCRINLTFPIRLDEMWHDSHITATFCCFHLPASVFYCFFHPHFGYQWVDLQLRNWEITAIFQPPTCSVELQPREVGIFPGFLALKGSSSRNLPATSRIKP